MIYSRGWNNAQLSDMTKGIWRLIDHKFSNIKFVRSLYEEKIT